MKIRHRISTEGSDRGTGYNISGRMIRRNGVLLIGWLNAPIAAKQPARVMLGVCDGQTGNLRRAFQLGEGIDNHCGPALAMDGGGRLHAIIGAHHGPFLYRWSDDPENPDAWSNPEPLGPADTYPALAADRHGTLHLAHRERADRWQLWYRRKKAGQPWEPPVPIAISPVPGYNHFMHSLTVGPSGALHLVFQFHYGDTGNAADCRGRAAVYVRSDDGGDTWYNEGQKLDGPLTVRTMRAICHIPNDGQHSLRVANHIADADDCPWFFCSYPGYASGVLWHSAETGWDLIDLADRLDGLNMAGGRATCLSRDASGRLHFAFATHPQGEQCRWFDPCLELFYAVFDAQGNRLSLTQITPDDPEAANWLPALEPWNWVRPEQTFEDGHWMMYTRGLNAGGIGGDNKNPMKTEIYLGKM